MQHISTFVREDVRSSLFIHKHGKRTNIFRYLTMAAVTAIIALSLSVSFIHAEAPLSTDITTSSSPEVLVDGLTVAQRAAKIDAFFASKGNLPLTGQGIVFVTMADKYDLDWKLVASIGFIESTGGKFVPASKKYNAFGWGSAKIPFDSYADAIETVTMNLAGFNNKTAHHYKDKTLDQIIDKYNPPSVRANYNKLIKSTMVKIATAKIPDATAQGIQLASK